MKNNIKIIVLSLIILLVSFLLEFTISNKDYYSISNKGTHYIKLNQKKETIKGNKKLVYYKISNKRFYVDDIYISYNKEEKEIELDICQEKVSCNKTYNGNTKLTGNEVYYSIDKKLNKPYIKIVTNVNDNVNVNSVKVINELQFNIFRFIFFVITLSNILAIIYILKEKKKINLSIVFLTIALSYGTLIAVLNPPFKTLDEGAHLIRSYYNSKLNIIMGPAEDIYWPKNTEKFLSLDSTHSYRDFVRGYQKCNSLTSKGYKKIYIHSTAINYIFVPYLISGLGMAVARIFNSSLITMFYMGRIFNLIFYSIMGYIILKKLKNTYFEKMFFVLLISPICIFQAASHTADMFTNIFALFALAYILSIKFQKNKASMKDLLLIFMACSICTMSKLVYFPIFYLIFLIPKEKMPSEKINKLYKIGGIITSVVLAAVLFIYGSKFNLVQHGVNKNVDSIKQMIYIMKHPFKYLYAIIILFNKYGYYYTFLLCDVGYNNSIGHIPAMYIVFGLFALSLSNCKQLLNNKDKLICIIVYILIIGISVSSMYITFNTVGTNDIQGFQGRYLIPEYLLPFLLLNTKTGIKINENKINKILLISSVIIMTLLAFSFINAYYL